MNVIEERSTDLIPPVKMLLGVLRRQDFKLQPILEGLADHFGSPDLKTPEMAFIWSDYYQREMGKELVRQFFTFPRLIDRHRLVALKLGAIDTENRFRDASGRRPVNLDPGYLTLEQLVLASTKPQAHRLYLERGIWADVHLVYHTGAFHPLQWTYPDYGEEEQRAWLAQARQSLKLKLRGKQCHEA